MCLKSFVNPHKYAFYYLYISTISNLCQYERNFMCSISSQLLFFSQKFVSLSNQIVQHSTTEKTCIFFLFLRCDELKSKINCTWGERRKVMIKKKLYNINILSILTRVDISHYIHMCITQFKAWFVNILYIQIHGKKSGEPTQKN